MQLIIFKLQQLLKKFEIETTQLAKKERQN